MQTVCPAQETAVKGIDYRAGESSQDGGTPTLAAGEAVPSSRSDWGEEAQTTAVIVKGCVYPQAVEEGGETAAPWAQFSQRPRETVSG